MNSSAKYDAIAAAGNFDRPQQELLLELVQAYTDYQVPPSKIFFYEGLDVDQRPEIRTDEDAFVRADIDPGYDYRLPGVNGFLYRRLPLSLLAPRARVGLEPISGEFPFETLPLLNQINRYYQVQLRPQDVVNTVYDVGDNIFILRAATTSWCFSGELVVPLVFSSYVDGTRVTQDGNIRVTQSHDIRVAGL